VTDDPIKGSDLVEDFGGNNLDGRTTHHEFTSLLQCNWPAAHNQTPTTSE
jgi:hypothetical protein